MFVNIVSSIFAIVGIVLYAIHLGTVNISWRCHSLDGNYGCHYLAAVAQVSRLPQNRSHNVYFFSKILNKLANIYEHTLTQVGPIS